MLEQYTVSIEKPSQRFLQIKSFLEKAVQIVPLESIFLAIGCGPIKISIAYAKALYDSKPQFQPSPMVLQALKLASFRMSTGYSSNEYNAIALFVYRNLPYIVMPSQVIIEIKPTKVSSISEEDIKIQFEVLKNGQKPPYICAYVDYYFCNENRIESTSIKMYAEYFSKMAAETQQKLFQNEFHDTFLGASIDRLYPIVPSIRRQGYSSFQSPLDVLREAREKISLFIEEKVPNVGEELPQAAALHNEDMLSVVKDVLEHSLKMCAVLLGSFMEQQISIPLIKDGKKSMADKITSSSSHLASIGCWALYSSTFDDLLLHLEGNPIVVELTDYFCDFVGQNVPIIKSKQRRKSKRSQYSEKLMFLLAASKAPMPTVTCSSEYISYSLERQICQRFNFTKDESLSTLIKNWDTFFEKDVLVFVQKSFRPIIGRWLKWATYIYDLRECLAKYTCVGVTGLVNSGKSQLVSKLFKVKVYQLISC